MHFLKASEVGRLNLLTPADFAQGPTVAPVVDLVKLAEVVPTSFTDYGEVADIARNAGFGSDYSILSGHLQSAIVYGLLLVDGKGKIKRNGHPPDRTPDRRTYFVGGDRVRRVFPFEHVYGEVVATPVAAPAQGRIKRALAKCKCMVTARGVPREKTS